MKQKYRLELSLLEKKGEYPKDNDLLRFIFIPLGKKIPKVASKIEYPISWSWRWVSEKSSIDWKLISFQKVKLKKSDIDPIVKEYKQVKLSNILQGYTKNSVVSQNSIHLVSRKISGVVYLNGEVVDFIAPGNDIHISLKKGGTVAIYPLLGGPPSVRQYMKIPIKWVIGSK